MLSEKDLKVAMKEVTAAWWEGRKFKHPVSGNMVLFLSLPSEEQKKLNDQVEKEHPESFEKSKEKEPKEEVPKKKELTTEEKLHTILTTSLKDLHQFVNDPAYASVRGEVALRIDQDGLHKMVKDPDYHVRWQVSQRIDQNGLHKMINDDSPNIRMEVVQRVDLDGLHKMISDEDDPIRREVARRIDQDGLYKMMNDESSFVRTEVTQRIDQNGLYKMINDKIVEVRLAVARRIDLDGLYKMVEDDETYVRKVVEKRIKNIKLLGEETIKHFKETKSLDVEKLSPQVIDLIKSVDGENVRAEEVIAVLDELYKPTKYWHLHDSSRSQWLESSNNDGSGLLKYAVSVIFGGKLRHHDAIKDFESWTKDMEDKFDVDVEEYVKIQRDLTKKLLDIKYPGMEDFTLYRGTSTEEEEETEEKGEVRILQNPLSSWTIKKEVAYSFAKGYHGRLLKTKFKKDEIFSCYLTHSHSGFEAEFITIGKEDRLGESLLL